LNNVEFVQIFSILDYRAIQLLVFFCPPFIGVNTVFIASSITMLTPCRYFAEHSVYVTAFISLANSNPFHRLSCRCIYSVLFDLHFHSFHTSNPLSYQLMLLKHLWTIQTYFQVKLCKTNCINVCNLDWEKITPNSKSIYHKNKSVPYVLLLSLAQQVQSIILHTHTNMLLLEQERLSLPEHLGFSGVRIDQSLVFCVVFVDHCFSFFVLDITQFL